MNHLRLSALFFLVTSALVAAGCEIETETQFNEDVRPASTLVINEVFTLPAAHPTYFCWIELLNPTRDTVDLSGWTLSFTTGRYTEMLSIAYDMRDSTFQTFRFLGRSEEFDGVGLYDVPFAEGVYVDTFGIPTPLPPTHLFTIVSDSNRFDDHTRIGPGPGYERYREKIRGPIYSQVLGGIIDTFFQVVNIRTKLYSLHLSATEQLQLKNPAGNVVDVVRYGNYSYPGPGVDPYPGNRSVGLIPEFEAIGRYARGYFTGNTANDFYVTKPNLRPTPHAYNPAYKELN